MTDATSAPESGTSSELTVWDLAGPYRPYLRAVAAEVLGSEFAAKVDPSDVVQAALLAAHEKRPQFRGDTLDDWRHWLVAIVRNEARQARRFWRRQRRRAERDTPLAFSPEHLPEIVDAGTSPSRNALRREEAARLMAALERLRPDDREVIRLRHFEGLPHAQIAARLGRSETAVRQLWIAALGRLRQEIGIEAS